MSDSPNLCNEDSNYVFVILVIHTLSQYKLQVYNKIQNTQVHNARKEKVLRLQSTTSLLNFFLEIQHKLTKTSETRATMTTYSQAPLQHMIRYKRVRP